MSPAILIIDRQVAVRQIMQQALRKIGYKTVVVDNPHQALVLLSKYEFHAVILDDDLEGMRGGQLCRQIKRQPATKHIPVVIASESLRIVNPDYVKATGADIALLKPVSADKVCEAIESLLRTKTV